MLGRIFGSKENVGNHAAIFIIVIMAAVGVLAMVMHTGIEPREYWKEIFMPVAGTATGFLFGQAIKVG